LRLSLCGKVLPFHFGIVVKGGLKVLLGDLIIAGFAMASGFVAAGVIASFYQLVTETPARFDISADRMWAGTLKVVLLMFAGPAILMRHAIRARIIERRPLGWLAASLAVSAAWSLCSGVVVLEFALAIGDTIA
jgi:hypothetical protein